MGAGASQEVGFPVGTQLARAIGEKLQTHIDYNERVHYFEDRTLFQELRRHRHGLDIAAYVSAAATINEGVHLANSIDDFLNIHSGDAALIELGKAAIVQAILDAEQRSTLFVDPSNIYNKMDFNKIENTWFVKLMRVLGSGGNPTNVKEIFSTAAFIIFNYDRCIEHFLIHALQALYAISRQEASEIVTQITIIHPYGKIGELDRIPFGNDGLPTASYFNLARSIKTYTERLEQEAELDRIRAEMRDADCIVFLGFSYLEQNLEVVRPTRQMRRKPIFGTAYGMSTSDRDVTDSQLEKMFVPSQYIDPNPFIELNNEVKCSQFFDFYARSLSAPKTEID
ncbi:hypothetical protein [Afipia clevelandensis]|uniref:hypothetical protein n=1 Tax=Afipia clevelandensis TaxID=1034 RepID=UPI001AEC4CB7|nr:hypothetical protein [Afipia clevelandensis]